MLRLSKGLQTILTALRVLSACSLSAPQGFPSAFQKLLKTSQVRFKALNVSTWALQVTLKSAPKPIELPPCP